MWEIGINGAVKLSRVSQFRVPVIGYLRISSLEVKSDSKKACY